MFILFYSAALENANPQISGPVEVNANVGETLNISLTVTDADDNDTVTLTFTGSLSEGEYTVGDDGIFTWTPHDLTPVTLR